MATSSDQSQQASSVMLNLTWLGTMLYAAFTFLRTAYSIRLLAIEEFGLVIHEFDPYFNFRATEVSLSL